MNNEDERCHRCGKDPARGYATINGRRYCHEGPDPTCYMAENWDRSARSLLARFPEANLGGTP